MGEESTHQDGRGLVEELQKVVRDGSSQVFDRLLSEHVR